MDMGHHREIGNPDILFGDEDGGYYGSGIQGTRYRSMGDTGSGP